MSQKKFVKVLSFLINNTPYAKTLLTNLGIGKVISYGQKHGMLDFDHYTDTYWNELDMVQKYINENATGNPQNIWQKDILSRFSDLIPFEKCLVVGCGNGWVERQLFDLGIGKNFDAFDISEKYLTLAKESKGNRRISYFKADLNNLESFPIHHYDAIFNVGALHHGFRLARAMWILNQTIKPNGLMFNFDYVGPAQHLYSDEHLKLLHNLNQSLPQRFQSPHHFRPTKEDFAFGDPTEAVNADLVKPTFERFFDIVYQNNINGGIGYPLLVNNIAEFQKNDDESQYHLGQILKNDKKYTIENKIPVLFWYGIGTPKKKENILYHEFLPSSRG